MKRQPSINIEPAVVAGAIATSGGSLVPAPIVGSSPAEPIRQKGVDETRATNGWEFVTDGTDGLLRLYPASASAGGSRISTVTARTNELITSPLQAWVFAPNGNTIRVGVYTADGSARVDLTADDVVVEVVSVPT